MPWTAKQLITWAAQQIGTKENPAGSNKVWYWDYYKQHCGMNYQGSPWCAAFVTTGMSEGGLWSFTKDEGRFRYCPSLVNWAKQNGKWRDRLVQPKTGWIVLFANKGTACHVGFVEKYISKNSIQTIEGNTSVTSNDNGGAVMRRTRSYGTEGSSWYILGFVEPDFGTETTSTAKKTNEQIANEVIAGKWGNGSDRTQKLKSAGYDPDAIQAIVNKKLGASSSSQKPASKPSTSTAKPSSPSKPAVPTLGTGTYSVVISSGLAMRQGPSTKYAKKTKSQITANARANCMIGADGHPYLKKGTRMSVVQISKEGSSRVWGKIPSGWVCLWENNKYYAKKA